LQKYIQHKKHAQKKPTLDDQEVIAHANIDEQTLHGQDISNDMEIATDSEEKKIGSEDTNDILLTDAIEDLDLGQEKIQYDDDAIEPWIEVQRSRKAPLSKKHKTKKSLVDNR